MALNRKDVYFSRDLESRILGDYYFDALWLTGYNSPDPVFVYCSIEEALLDVPQYVPLMKSLKVEHNMILRHFQGGCWKSINKKGTYIAHPTYKSDEKAYPTKSPGNKSLNFSGFL